MRIGANERFFESVEPSDGCSSNRGRSTSYHSIVGSQFCHDLEFFIFKRPSMNYIISMCNRVCILTKESLDSKFLVNEANSGHYVVY